jgi:hypothetical protein
MRVMTTEGSTVELSHLGGGLEVVPYRNGTFALKAYGDPLRREDYSSWIVAVGPDKNALVAKMHELEERNDPYGTLREARTGYAERREQAVARLAASHDAELQHLTT